MKSLLPTILYSTLGLLLGLVTAWFLTQITGTTGPFGDEVWMNAVVLAPCGFVIGILVGHRLR